MGSSPSIRSSNPFIMIKSNKYSTKRKTVRLSLNKYSWFNHKKLKSKSFSFFRKKSLYSIQLRAKQLLKAYYGSLKEKIFKRLFFQSLSHPNPTQFLILLEKRLDVVLVRMNLVHTIFLARQLISHGHVYVNDIRITSSSFKLLPGHSLSLSPKGINIIKSLFLNSKIIIRNKVPNYLEVNYNIASGIFIRDPHVKEIPYSIPVNMTLIHQFYTKS